MPLEPSKPARNAPMSDRLPPLSPMSPLASFLNPGLPDQYSRLRTTENLHSLMSEGFVSPVKSPGYCTIPPPHIRHVPKIRGSEKDKEDKDGKTEKKEKKERRKSKDIDRTTKDKGKEKKGKEPRMSRFAMAASLTSSKPPEKVASRVYKKLSEMLQLTVVKTDTFLLTVTDAANNVEFQVEICKLHVLSMCCVRFHRIHGDSQLYQTITQEIVSKITPL